MYYFYILKAKSRKKAEDQLDQTKFCTLRSHFFLMYNSMFPIPFACDWQAAGPTSWWCVAGQVGGARSRAAWPHPPGSADRKSSAAAAEGRRSAGGQPGGCATWASAGGRGAWWHGSHLCSVDRHTSPYNPGFRFYWEWKLKSNAIERHVAQEAERVDW